MASLVAAGCFTCLPGCNLIETRSGAGAATGGSTSSSGSSGGTTASGGSITSTGGSTSTVASTARGGAGGAASSGGVTTATGGTSSSGGVTTDAGGTIGSGGTSTGADAGNAGGMTGSGGLVGTGASTARGGTVGSGGTSASTTSTSTCTDTPPPGQTPTCAEWASYNMCSQSWFATYCDQTCGRCSGAISSGGVTTAGGASARGGTVGSGGVTGSGGTSARGGTTGSGGGGGASGPGTTNPQISGTSGWASRYWDCCKPSCGWTGNSNPPVPSCQKDGMTRTSADAQNGCEGGGSAFECYDFSPWYDAGTNLAYGFAAYNGVACGTCFELQFTGGGNSGPNAGATAIKGQQMIVQVINIGGISANQFDLLIPGGGVGAMTAGCTAQWGNVDLGVTYGGLLSECGGDCTCMKGKCQSVFGSLGSSLKNGCDWFTGWFSCADNPQLVYKQVSCPSQITSKTGLSR